MKRFLLRCFPWLLPLKSWLVAAGHAFSPQHTSYSQGSEDFLVEEVLRHTHLEGSLYVDVGANHPTRLSNTYKFYRKGLSGVVIEPNPSLLRLHRVFRKRDVHLGFGCGDAFGLLEFAEARSHVLSGFQHTSLKASAIRGFSLVPVIPLDAVMAFFPQEVFLLSIDVEGFDLFVARGAEETLRRTKVVIIKGDAANRPEIEQFFANHAFRLHAETKHNLIFLNSTWRGGAR